MIVIYNQHKVASYNNIYLDENEKQQIKRELTLLISNGASYIFVENKLAANNMLSVYDNNKQKIGCLVGNSAVILAYIILKCEDNPFFAVPISIEYILQEYCKE